MMPQVFVVHVASTHQLQQRQQLTTAVKVIDAGRKPLLIGQLLPAPVVAENHAQPAEPGAGRLVEPVAQLPQAAIHPQVPWLVDHRSPVREHQARDALAAAMAIPQTGENLDDVPLLPGQGRQTPILQGLVGACD